MEKETIIELKNIRKEFPGVVALDNVNMKIRASEVHALVGENGAGKSTLMKILSGTYSNYGGSVICKGEEIHMKCEKDAFKYGISIVAQELNYVSELSIAENLFLGREPKKGKVFVNKAERLKETQRLLDEMGLDYNPREKMGNLNVAQRQMIEILKSLSRDSRVIIMDEPTSALTSKESEILFSKVNELKQKGMYHSLLLYLVETTMTDIFMWVRQMKMQEKHRVSICVMHSRMELQSCILPVHQMISSMSIVKKDWKKHLRKIQISKSLMNIT